MSDIGTKRTLPPSSGVSDAVQAKDARLEPDRHLANCRAFPKGSDVQFWMQFAAQWQKAWADTMTFWGNLGSEIEQHSNWAAGTAPV